MIHILGQIVIGLFIGIIAKFLLPGYDGGGVAAGVAAEEGPVVTSDGDAAERTLGGIVVDG